MGRLAFVASLALIAACSSDPAADPSAADWLFDASPAINFDAVEADTRPAETTVVTPTSGPMSGYYSVQIDTADWDIQPESVLGVTVAGIRAIDVAVQGERVVAMVQGAPEHGPAEVVVTTSLGETSLGDVFTYTGPPDPLFARMVGIGASLSQGVQRGTPSKHGSLMAPVAQIARQMGTWVGLPLPVEGLFPQVLVEQIGAPPECAVPNFLDYIEDQAADILTAMSDPETGEFGYHFARVDPDIEVRNISVGGTHAGDVLHGPPKDDLAINFVSHMIYDPYGPFLSPIERSQVQWVEDFKPSLVVSTDIYGNDIIKGIVNAEGIDPELITPAESLHADIQETVARVAAASDHFFVATLPQPTLLPAVERKRKQLTVQGMPAGEIQALMDAVDLRAQQANDVLVAAAAECDNVHIVDLAGATAGMAANGFCVGEYTLTTRLFGGMLSLDGVHFTDTGYAMVANVFLIEINKVLGTDVPLIDMETVYLQDYESIPVYLDAGFDPPACE